MILLFRCLILILTLETAIRYGHWYYIGPDPRRRMDGHAPVLRELMLGIAIGAAAMAAFSVYGLVFGGMPPEGPRRWLFFVLDVLLAFAFVKHLFPVWKIACRFDQRQVWAQLVLRFGLAGGLDFGLLYKGF